MAFSQPSRAIAAKQLIWLMLISLFGMSSVAAKENLPSEDYQVRTIASGLNSPWSMAELPDGTWLITERDGHVVVAKDGQQWRINLGLDGLYVAGQGGLLDVVLSPDFEQSKEVLFSYAQGGLKANRLVIAKAVFDGEGFSKPEIVYQVATDKDTPQHYAGRVLILPDNSILFSSGDGFDYREQAQVVTNQLGKILRVNLDGSIPSDNPYSTHQDSSAHAVYSIGHRNPQGLVYDYDAQRIVSHEHGPKGGDELNFLVAGKNYGWPVATYGRDYSGARISPFTEYEGMEQPFVNWTPSIAPSGMVYYGSKASAFASLQGHVLISTLVDRKLYAVSLADGKFTQTHVFPELAGRLRDVVITRNGNLAVLGDAGGAELRLVTAQ
nr:PQQ-dependent sugar dehydrogenase [Paraferrimonas sedimenticola]